MFKIFWEFEDSEYFWKNIIYVFEVFWENSLIIEITKNLNIFIPTMTKKIKFLCLCIFRHRKIVLRSIITKIDLSVIWRPSSLSELTPLSFLFNMGLTHLGWEASIWIYIFWKNEKIFWIIIFSISSLYEKNLSYMEAS